MRKANQSKYIKWALILVALVVLLVFPKFLTTNYYRRLFNQVFINAIVLLGMNFITGLVGQMNLGMAGMYALGAYTAGLMTVKLGVSPWLGLIGAVFMGCLIGVVLGVPSLKITGIYLALTTMSFGEIVRIVLTNMANLTGGAAGLRGIPGYNLFGIVIDDDKSFYYLLLAFVIIMALIAHRIVNSKWGRAFKAVRDNEESVETCGINISSIKLKAFMLSAIFGCVAGALYSSLMGYINPTDFSADLSVKFIMMLMLGGVGTISGSILGAGVVTLLPEALKFMDTYYWFVFCGIVLICSVIMPNGLIRIILSAPDKIAKTSKSKAKAGEK